MATLTHRTYTAATGQKIHAGKLAPAAGGQIVEFTLENFDAEPTRALFRGGMPFKKGDVPAGSVPVITRGGAPVAAQFDERVTWKDGSLKYAVCHLRDVDIPGAGSYTYAVAAAPGSFDNTGTKTLASVASANAVTVDIDTLTQYNSTTTVARASGAARASFAAHAAVATRVTKVHSGPVCEGWTVWGMFKDGATGAGAEDAHLKAIWHIDVWKDASGAILDTEFGCELAQDWWAATDKFRLNYNATLKRNGTTVQAYNTVQHPYHSHWLTVRMQEDGNHGKRHWGAAVPTLVYKFSKQYWRESGMMTLQDPAYIPPAKSTQTYQPLKNMGHRSDINGTGGYAGRGVITVHDVYAFMRQDATSVRTARTNAFAGMHINYHYRDERVRTRASEAPDIANTLIPLLWHPKAEAASTFPGLPAPKHAYKGKIYNYVADRGGFVDQLGGGGVWPGSASGDSSHLPPFCTYAYLLEGERYMLDSLVDLATSCAYNAAASQFGGMPWLHWYNDPASRAEMGTPSTRWGGIMPYMSGGNERSVGLATSTLGAAAGFIPDNDLQGAYMRGWNSHNADYLEACLQYMPPAMKSAGVTYNRPGGAPHMALHWQNALVVLGLTQNMRWTEETKFTGYADMSIKLIVGMSTRSYWDLDLYRVFHGATADGYSLANLPYLPQNFLAERAVYSVNSVLEMPHYLRYPISNNDEVHFIRTPSNPTIEGLTDRELFYVVNAASPFFQVSRSKGGTPLVLPDTAVVGTTKSTYLIGIRTFGDTTTIPQAPTLIPSGDSYIPMSSAALVHAEAVGLPSCPPGLADEVRAFIVNVNYALDPRWKYAKL